MKTKYEEIVNVNNIATNTPNQGLANIINLANQEKFNPANKDAKQVLLLVIDMQNDFMEDIGTLPVVGSKGDVERLTKFIYNNMENLTKIMCSLDTHAVEQIFHPAWWIDENGNNPDPYTLITYDDILKGKYTPAFGDIAKSIEYVKKLEEYGKQQLCIWPYHCLQGHFGANLEAEFTKMIYFHSIARKSNLGLVQKGTDRYTEMYGIIKAEYDPKGFVNTPVLNAVERFDEIYIAGEAASHCLLESGKQILENFKDRPEITTKITILEDCTSPISGFEQVTEEAFEEFKRIYGIKVMKSTDVKIA